MALRSDSEASRVRLIDAATRLFADRGFDATTVDEVARAAGVTTRTFFRHFPGKVDAAFPWHQQRLAQFRRLLNERFDPDNPFRTVADAVRAYAAEHEKRREQALAEWRFVTASTELMARDAQLDRDFQAALADTLARGRLDEFEAAFWAGTLFGAMRAVLHEWLSGGCRRELVALGAPLLELLAWRARVYDEEHAARRNASAEGGRT